MEGPCRFNSSIYRVVNNADGNGCTIGDFQNEKGCVYLSYNISSGDNLSLNYTTIDASYSVFTTAGQPLSGQDVCIPLTNCAGGLCQSLTGENGQLTFSADLVNGSLPTFTDVYFDECRATTFSAVFKNSSIDMASLKTPDNWIFLSSEPYRVNEGARRSAAHFAVLGNGDMDAWKTSFSNIDNETTVKFNEASTNEIFLKVCKEGLMAKCPLSDSDTVTNSKKSLGGGVVAGGILIALVSLFTFFYRMNRKYQAHMRAQSRLRVLDLRTKRLKRLNLLEHKANTPFRQMHFRSCSPNTTPFSVTACLFLCFLLLTPLGILLLVQSAANSYLEFRYDDKCEGQNICNINIPITDNMTAPIFVYYKLDNFYQNHRSFVKSINFKQIRAFDGMESGEAERVAKSCTPDIYKYPMNGLQEDQRNKTLYPCGLIAHSFFNDQFTSPILQKNTSAAVQRKYLLMGPNFAKKGITYPSDLEKKFIDREMRSDETRWTYDPTTGRDFELPPVDDEDLINWMRVSFTSTFTKLYRRINEENFTAGDTLTLTVVNNFQVYDGSKSIVFATAGILGGKNFLIGEIYVFVGIICLLSGFFVCIKSDLNSVDDEVLKLLEADAEADSEIRSEEAS